MIRKESSVGKNDVGCTFYRNTMRSKHSTLGTRKAKFLQYFPCTDGNLYSLFEHFGLFHTSFMSLVKFSWATNDE